MGWACALICERIPQSLRKEREINSTSKCFFFPFNLFMLSKVTLLDVFDFSTYVFLYTELLVLQWLSVMICLSLPGTENEKNNIFVFNLYLLLFSFCQYLFTGSFSTINDTLAEFTARGEKERLHVIQQPPWSISTPSRLSVFLPLQEGNFHRLPGNQSSLPL